MPVMERMLE